MLAKAISCPINFMWIEARGFALGELRHSEICRKSVYLLLDLFFFLHDSLLKNCCTAYGFDDFPHLGDPVLIVEQCGVFQKNLLESLSPHSNLSNTVIVLKQR